MAQTAAIMQAVSSEALRVAVKVEERYDASIKK